MRPRGLDLYACQGGAWRGYTDAGFEMYGVELDKTHRKYYPGPMCVGNALGVLRLLLAGAAVPFQHKDGRVERVALEEFAFIHASPPCQHATAGTRAARKKGKKYPALIEPTRDLLAQTGLLWVIENVRAAALRDPVELCGCMFAMTALDEDGCRLRLERPRKFEANFTIAAPNPHDHDPDVWVAGVYGGGRARKPGQTAEEHRHDCKYVRKGGYVPASDRVRRDLLGIHWPTTQWALFQSIPPAYAEWVGTAVRAELAMGRVA